MSVSQSFLGCAGPDGDCRPLHQFGAHCLAVYFCLVGVGRFLVRYQGLQERGQGLVQIIVVGAVGDGVGVFRRGGCTISKMR